MEQTRFYSLDMTLSREERKLWIHTRFSLLKNWPCVTSCRYCIAMLSQQYRRYKRVYSFLLSVLGNSRRETQIIKAYADTRHHARLILWCLRSQLISAGWDRNAQFNGRYSAPVFFEILKFSGSSLPGMTSTTYSIHSSPIFYLGIYYNRW